MQTWQRAGVRKKMINRENLIGWLAIIIIALIDFIFLCGIAWFYWEIIQESIRYGS
jgi:hypothetical protein